MWVCKEKDDILVNAVFKMSQKVLQENTLYTIIKLHELGNCPE